MKSLIVNGDDFGLSRGINRGILTAHRRGILTSASLMVDAPWGEEAAELSRTAPALSVGLHADLDRVLAGDGGPAALREALQAQFARFGEVMGRPPTHLDAHHNTHRDARALPHFRELARRHRLALREHSGVRYFSKFYGRWAGSTHLEQITAESLAGMLATDIGNGITELSCHPGYLDPQTPTGYRLEREAELRALCDPLVRRVLTGQSIRLISYHDLSRGRAADAG